LDRNIASAGGGEIPLRRTRSSLFHSIHERQRNSFGRKWLVKEDSNVFWIGKKKMLFWTIRYFLFNFSSTSHRRRFFSKLEISTSESNFPLLVYNFAIAIAIAKKKKKKN